MLDELQAILATDFGAPTNAVALADVLYRRCYVRSLDDRAATPADDETDLTPALAGANRSREGWDLGWRVEQPLDESRVLARKAGAARAFRAGQYVCLRGPGPRAVEDEPIRVFAPAGSDAIQTDFYYAFGETVADCDEFEELLRYYWNVTAEGAPRLMEAITREFNRFQVPFRFKCGRTAAVCSRRDAAVLYLHRRYADFAGELVERVHAAIEPWLRDGVPLFTKRLGPGLGFAEDPGGSFGQNRCLILAEAMLVERSVDEVRRQFSKRGLSLDEPWRNPRP